MILLRNSIFKFYDNHDIVEYMPNKVDRDKEEQEMKKKIRLLDDLPQLVEEKKTKKEEKTKKKNKRKGKQENNSNNNQNPT